MNKITAIFFIVIMLSNLSFAEAKTNTTKPETSVVCLEGKITWIVNQKKHQETSKYCLSKNQENYNLTSQACLEANSKCQAIQASNEPIPSNRIYQKMGSPHFHLCHYLQGKPQFIKVWDKKHWISLTRCLFPDKSFVDLHQLQRYHDIGNIEAKSK